MMKMEKILFTLILVTIFHLTSCFPIESIKPQPQIIKYGFNQRPNNGYNYFYQLSDGHTRNETGSFDDETGIFRVTGFYSYNDEDMKKYLVRYSADENGFVTNDEAEEIEADISIDQPMEISSAAVATLSG